MVNLLWLLVVVTTLAPTLGGQTHRRRSFRPSALSLLASAVAAPPTATTDGTRPSSKKSDDEEHDEEDDDDDINPSPGSGVATSLSTRSNAAHNQATKIKVAAPRNKKEAAVAPLDDATADDDDDNADGKESPPSPSPFALLGNPLVKQVGGPHEPDTPPTNSLTLLSSLCIFIPSRVACGQFAPTAVYMLASRVIMKLNFLDPAVVQVWLGCLLPALVLIAGHALPLHITCCVPLFRFQICRAVFAVYLVLSQVSLSDPYIPTKAPYLPPIPRPRPRPLVSLPHPPLAPSQLLFAVLRRRIEAADDQSPVTQVHMHTHQPLFPFSTPCLRLTTHLPHIIRHTIPHRCARRGPWGCRRTR